MMHSFCEWCSVHNNKTEQPANLRFLIIYNAESPEKAVPERLANILLMLFQQVMEPNFWREVISSKLLDSELTCK